MGANFLRTRDMIEEMLGSNPLVMQLPIGGEDTFEGVFDLVKMQAITWNGEVSSHVAPEMKNMRSSKETPQRLSQQELLWLALIGSMTARTCIGGLEWEQAMKAPSLMFST